jgi:hypothetical protein
MELFETTMLKGKTQPVSIEQVKRAYERVRSKGGAGGVDRVEIPAYEQSRAKPSTCTSCGIAWHQAAIIHKRYGV